MTNVDDEELASTLRVAGARFRNAVRPPDLRESIARLMDERPHMRRQRRLRVSAVLAVAVSVASVAIGLSAFRGGHSHNHPASGTQSRVISGLPSSSAQRISSCDSAVIQAATVGGSPVGLMACSGMVLLHPASLTVRVGQDVAITSRAPSTLHQTIEIDRPDIATITVVSRGIAWRIHPKAPGMAIISIDSELCAPPNQGSCGLLVLDVK